MRRPVLDTPLDIYVTGFELSALSLVCWAGISSSNQFIHCIRYCFSLGNFHQPTLHFPSKTHVLASLHSGQTKEQQVREAFALSDNLFSLLLILNNFIYMIKGLIKLLFTRTQVDIWVICLHIWWGSDGWWKKITRHHPINITKHIVRADPISYRGMGGGGGGIRVPIQSW